MSDLEKESEEQTSSKEVIAKKVTGTVKWFNVKKCFGFISRDDNEEDVFVHKTAVIKNNPKKYVQSLGDGETVEFDVVVGENGHEAANVTGPDGVAVKGSVYAADKQAWRRRGYRYDGYYNGYDDEDQVSGPPRGRGRGRGRGAPYRRGYGGYRGGFRGRGRGRGGYSRGYYDSYRGRYRGRGGFRGGWGGPPRRSYDEEEGEERDYSSRPPRGRRGGRRSYYPRSFYSRRGRGRRSYSDREENGKEKPVKDEETSQEKQDNSDGDNKARKSTRPRRSESQKSAEDSGTKQAPVKEENEKSEE